MKAALLALLLSGADGGTELPVYYRISQPSLVPGPGYYYPDDAHLAVDTEMKRLQWIEANPPRISVEGYLIAIVVSGVAGLVGGVVVGLVLHQQLGQK